MSRTGGFPPHREHRGRSGDVAPGDRLRVLLTVAPAGTFFRFLLFFLFFFPYKAANAAVIFACPCQVPAARTPRVRLRFRTILTSLGSLIVHLRLPCEGRIRRARKRSGRPASSPIG